MKTTPSLQLATMAAFLMAGQLFAQTTVSSGTDGAGLLGLKYSAIEFGYIHHVESPPQSLRRFGIMSQAPLPEMTNLDGAFHYDFIRGSAYGRTQQTHRVHVSFIRHFLMNGAKPFIEGGIGWAWEKRGPVKEDSFYYRAAVGAEVTISPNLTLTPFVAVDEASNLGAETAWNIGARLAYRMSREWVPAIRIQVDDEHNIEYLLAVNYRY